MKCVPIPAVMSQAAMSRLRKVSEEISKIVAVKNGIAACKPLVLARMLIVISANNAGR